MLYGGAMTSPTDYTAKIAKLLAQAEGPGTTEAEAEVFLRKAQELATLHSIDLAKARHFTVAKERTTPIQRTITLGVRGTRGLNTLVQLFGGIARANDVTINIAHNSTYVVAFGFSEDIDVAEALYASLTVQMASAAAHYRKKGTWRDEKAWSDRHWEYRPITWLTARLDFQQGYASRVGQRLAEAQNEAEQRVVTTETDNLPIGTALVLAAKRDQVADYYKTTSNARGSYRGGRRVGSWSTYDSGRQAGNSARLSGSTNLPGARREIA